MNSRYDKEICLLWFVCITKMEDLMPATAQHISIVFQFNKFCCSSLYKCISKKSPKRLHNYFKTKIYITSKSHNLDTHAKELGTTIH